MPKTCEEIPVSVPMKDGFLAGTLHLPRGRRPRKGWPAALLCHGFTGNRIEAHFLFVKASRAFAQAGLASLRIDFRGSGESSGRFQDMSVLTELADALAAWEFMGAVKSIDAKRRGVLGFSHGGAVAALLTGGLATEGRPPKCCALWSAVSDIQEIWKSRVVGLTKGGRRRLRFPIPLGAHLVGRRFFTDMKKAPRPVEALGAAGVKTLVLQGTADQAVPAHQPRDLAAACGPKLGTLRLIKDADHSYDRPDWEKKVIRITRDWLKKRL